MGNLAAIAPVVELAAFWTDVSDSNIGRGLRAGAIAAIVWASGDAVRANPFELFRGSPDGQVPAEQGVLLLGALDESGRPAIASETGFPGGVAVDTGAGNAIYAGYFNYNPLADTFINSEFPPLDRQMGFAVEFQVSLDRSTQNRGDRAGLSLTVISEDTLGIELGFEPDAIFAQSAIFDRAEAVAVNTQVLRNYELRVEGDRYQLFASDELILSGQLRSYFFNPRRNTPPLLFDPYTTPGFVFLGDNTSSESAMFVLTGINIENDGS
ncbi:MAG: hypothetical protein AAFX40_12860 [Cyanobacteria bacterium J06639_1]